MRRLWKLMFSMVIAGPAIAAPPPVVGSVHCAGGVAEVYTFYEVDALIRQNRQLVNVTVVQTSTGAVARSAPRPTIDDTYWQGYFLGVGQHAWDLGRSMWLNGSSFWFMFPARFSVGPNQNAQLNIDIGPGGMYGGLQIPMLCEVRRGP
jgi:hypothetical protein